MWSRTQKQDQFFVSSIINRLLQFVFFSLKRYYLFLDNDIFNIFACLYHALICVSVSLKGTTFKFCFLDLHLVLKEGTSKCRGVKYFSILFLLPAFCEGGAHLSIPVFP